MIELLIGLDGRFGTPGRREGDSRFLDPLPGPGDDGFEGVPLRWRERRRLEGDLGGLQGRHRIEAARQPRYPHGDDRVSGTRVEDAPQGRRGRVRVLGVAQPAGQAEQERGLLANARSGVAECPPVEDRRLTLSRPHLLPEHGSQNRDSLFAPPQADGRLEEGQREIRVVGISIEGKPQQLEGFLRPTFRLGSGDIGMDRIAVAAPPSSQLFREALLDSRETDGEGSGDAEAEATDVGPVGNATSTGVDVAQEGGGEEFVDEPEREHQPGGRGEGPEEEAEPVEELDLRPCETNQEGAHGSGDGAGCTDQRPLETGVLADEESRAGDPCRHIEESVQPATPAILDEGTGEKEKEQIGNQVQPSTVKKHVGEQAGRRGRTGDQSKSIPGMLVEGREGLLRQLLEPLLLDCDGAGGNRELSRFIPAGVELLAARTPGIAGDLGEAWSGLQVGMGLPVLVGVFDEPLGIPGDLAVEYVCHQEYERAREDDPVGHPGMAAHFT